MRRTIIPAVWGLLALTCAAREPHVSVQGDDAMSREKIGSHIVRNNAIFNCEQAGIAGSLGTLFGPTSPVRTESPGKAKVSGMGYENPDGSPLVLDADYSGKKRDPSAPSPGPFERTGQGTVRLRLWWSRR